MKITWGIRPQGNKPFCVISVTDSRSFNICSDRKIAENLSFKILDTQTTDTGNYSCEVVNAEEKFNRSIVLQVLAYPSVSLTINPAGFPECRTISGIPAAEISWIPESDNVTTRKEMTPDKTWTTVSTYRERIITGREVKCNISHPTFTHHKILSIVIPDTFVSVLAGNTGLLHCPHNPGDTLIMITWQIRPLYKPSCLISVTNDKYFNNCSERTIHENLSLKILNTQISDSGNYSCQMVNDHGTFQTNFMLQVLARPSVSLTQNPAGFPECWAIGGIPAAEISWIPESDNVISRREINPDKTWTVISTNRAQIITGGEVKCNVSHPTFTDPQILSTVKPDQVTNLIWWIALPIVLVFIFGLIFYKRRLISRTCCRMRKKQEHKEELEPYASFVQKVNTIYLSLPRS